MPNNDILDIEEKQELFSIRNRMVNIGYNYGKNEKCVKCEVDLILTKHKIRIEAKTKQLNKLNEKK